MAKDRNEMLAQFLKNEEFLELIAIENIELDSVSFSNKTESLLVESLKKLIFSYCNEDNPSQTLKLINGLIASEVHGS
ncbi:hypothetical protein LMJ53_14150 [Rheinheimera sp. UJ51]|uniref:hypothetical protein n=1 Tax=Rheinheimera sp. UJ51 TaxID=2892446 RepID=UPI001E513BB6|nr:hypothetical protein [Rheinheimera sp. UJ51]MCC5452866.1 hypothetical protein [Rheinheimera sp. UJ51]